MALIRCGESSGANVVNVGELFFNQQSEPVSGTNTYKKCSCSTGTTGYNKIAIISATSFHAYGSGGAATSLDGFAITIDPSTGIATIEVTQTGVGLLGQYGPRATCVVWEE